MSKSEILKGIINCLVESYLSNPTKKELEELKELMESYDNLNDIIENMYVNNIFKQQLMRLEDLF